jgi:hypothetical protein
MSERKFNSENTSAFNSPKCTLVDVPFTGENLQHKGITRDWVNAILKGSKLMAPGVEGINGVILANSMMLSAWTDNWVELPIDEELYVKLLNEKIAGSKNTKKVSAGGEVADISTTYNA